jgi:uncharacterized membrane protein
MKSIPRIFTGLVFVAAGIVHFKRPEFYEQIMPPYLPRHRELILISGFFEILGGVALCLPKVSRWAAWGITALLVAVYPANIHHAVIRNQFSGFLGSPLYHIIRLPMQGVIIWWVLRFGKKPVTETPNRAD